MIRFSHGGNLLFEYLEKGLGICIAVLLFGIMALTFTDVIGRYVFNAPLKAAYEVIKLAMGVIVFAGFPLVTRKSGHITVSLIESLVPPGLRRFLNIFASLVSTFVLGVFTWRLWVLAERFWDYGDATMFLRIAQYPFAFFMCLTAGIATLFSLANALKLVGPPRTNR
ncbi:MAG TPA: TRAP transporter small permease [Alphaproteobacteria bacterium]|nr:TRAP transporter small permease [Alphaproteobacteria bacterium]